MNKTIQVISIVAQFILEVFKAMIELMTSLLDYKAVQYVALFLFVFVIVYQFLIMLGA